MALPETLPASLGFLDVSNNRLSHLPIRLPSTLMALKLNTNQLTLVSCGLSCLRSDAQVDITDNLLSERAILNLHRLLNRQGYDGSRVFFSIQSNFEERRLQRPFIALLSGWLEAPDNRWEQIMQEDHAEVFKFFVARLSASVNYKNGLFRQQVATWLTSEDKKSLREMVFLIAQESLETC